MNWVRINNTLPDGPKVIALARLLGCSLNEALGVAVRWLTWLNAHAADGCSKLLLGEVDSVVCMKEGACAALAAIGWVRGDANGYVCAVDFERYNGAVAVKRAQGAARVKRMREREKGGRK